MIELRDALKKDYQEGQRAHALSAAQINVAFGHSGDSSWAYQLMDGNIPFPMAMVGTWRTLTGARHLMRWIASETHHVAAPLPDVALEDADIQAAAADGIDAFGEMVRKHADVTRDGRITRDESERFWRAGEHAISAAYLWMLYTRSLSRRPRTQRATSLAECAK